MDWLTTYLGQVLSLGTAIVWASAVILFKRSGERVHPTGLNLFKNMLAVALFLPTIYLLGGRLFSAGYSSSDYTIMLVSGALGIGVADTLFFIALNRLGAGLNAVVDCLYSPFTIGLSMIFLGERLTALQIVGVMLIVSAVLTASYEPGADKVERNRRLTGLLLGGLSMALMAIGIVMAKPVLEKTSLLWSTEIRLIGGVVVLWVVLLLTPSRGRILRSIAAPDRWKQTLLGSFLGAYLAMILWLGGMKYTQASVSAALNQTSNIFIYIFAAIFLHETITARKTLGIVLGVVGTLLVSFG